MTEQRKKCIAIGLTIICFSVAAVIFYRTVFGTSSGEGKGYNVVICTKCGGFEIPADECAGLIKKALGPQMMPFQKLVVECPKCHQKTCYMAQKCTQCQYIFAVGQTKDIQHPDRCPKCGFSKGSNAKITGAKL